jgi:hypothetical protein
VLKSANGAQRNFFPEWVRGALRATALPEINDATRFAASVLTIPAHKNSACWHSIGERLGTSTNPISRTFRTIAQVCS